MGKEWLYYLGGGGGGGDGGGSGGGGGSNTSRSSKRGKTSSSSSRDKVDTSTSSTPSGCMNAVFQLLDFHQFHFPNFHHQPSFKPDSFLPEEPTIPLKGVEAPRNSLEIIEETSFVGAATLSSTMKKGETLSIPMGMHIKTSGHTTSSRKDNHHDVSSNSECSSSSPAGTKTPTLVARLMGLDLLPETSSPRPSSSSSSSYQYSSSNYPSSSKSHLQNRPKNNKRPVSSSDVNDVMTRSHSLPETPRTSSSSARRSDVDQRFSLQISKENSNNEFEFSKFLTQKIAAAAASRGKEDENMRPGHYAKQIVKLFKENVSRRVGRDITNTVKNSPDHHQQRRDQHVVLLKSKKTSNIADYGASDPSNYCSPRLRLLETKTKPVSKNNQTSHSPKLPSSPLSPFTDQSKCVTVPLKEHEKQESPTQKCKKIASEKYGPRPKIRQQASDLIRNKQEESFVRSSSTSRAAQLSEKKFKRTPLSNVPTLLSMKKDPSPAATVLPQKQEQKQPRASDALSSKSNTQLSSCSSQSYKQEATHKAIVQPDINDYDNSSNGTMSNAGAPPLVEYISRILKCTGIHEFTQISFTKWYSPSHPLDPSIFHHLEISLPKINHGYNRKLIFELADELLVEILNPYISLNPWVNYNFTKPELTYGSQLIKTLCDKIRSFPSADCRVLEDIDELIERDLSGSCQLVERSAFEEEGDGIVKEIEGDILDTLVQEAAVMVFFQLVRTVESENRI